MAGLKLEAGAKRLTASWKEGEGITGYQLEYSLKKSFASAKKVNIAKAGTVAGSSRACNPARNGMCASGLLRR